MLITRYNKTIVSKHPNLRVGLLSFLPRENKNRRELHSARTFQNVFLAKVIVS